MGVNWDGNITMVQVLSQPSMKWDGCNFHDFIKMKSVTDKEIQWMDKVIPLSPFNSIGRGQKGIGSLQSIHDKQIHENK